MRYNGGNETNAGAVLVTPPGMAWKELAPMHHQSTPARRPRTTLSPIPCAQCGAIFHPRNASVRYCSPKCSYAARSAILPRFWRKVDKTTTPDGCWTWKASCYPDGYGQFKIGNRNNRAPRVSFELAYGPIPAGLLVCHRCDNPLCVRPDHLFLGTVKENSLDMVAKGRAPDGSTLPRMMGEDNPRAKLTAAQVSEIRSLHAAGGVTFTRLAVEYGVSSVLIAKIVHRDIWKSVPPEARTLATATRLRREAGAA